MLNLIKESLRTRLNNRLARGYKLIHVQSEKRFINTTIKAFSINDLLYAKKILNKDIGFDSAWILKDRPRFICDLGCNVGLFPLWIRHHTSIDPEGICYDASAEMVDRTKTNLSLNGCYNMHVFQAYLGEDDNESNIFYRHSSDIASSSIIDPALTNSWKKEFVPQRRDLYKDWLNLMGENQQGDILKIDIEGSEYGLFRDTHYKFFKLFKKIIVEYHEPLTNVLYVREALESLHRLVAYHGDKCGWACFERKKNNN